RKRTLDASAKPTTIASSATQYVANRANVSRLAGWPVAARNTAMTARNTVSVIVAFATDVTTRIHGGTRVFASRKLLVWSEIRPLLVPSAKKSHRKRPTIKSSL